MVSAQRHKLYGIIGSSLRHTLSPIIHNYLFKKFKLDYHYTKFESEWSQLRNVVNSIRTLNISGVNVTFPFKEILIPYLDKLDITSQKTGAVNTIKNSRGRLIGYNTDLFGVRATIQNRLKINIKGKTVLLLGAGGASRACMVELLRQKPDKVIVANRDISKAKYIISKIKNSGSDSNIKAMNIKNLYSLDQLDQPTLLINSTSANSSFLMSIIKELLKKRFFQNTIIFDLNYGQRALPKSHHKFPGRYVDGLYMLTAQAAASFHIWTGIKVEPDDIYKYVSKKIAG